MKAATAIILAAERASQMNSAKPTALHEVAGRPIIDWMLAAFEGCVETPPVIVDGSQQMIAAHAVSYTHLEGQRNRGECRCTTLPFS